MLDKTGKNSKSSSQRAHRIQAAGEEFCFIESQIISQLLEYCQGKFSLYSLSVQTLASLKSHPLLQKASTAIWFCDSEYKLEVIASDEATFEAKEELEKQLPVGKKWQPFKIKVVDLTRTPITNFAARIDIFLEKYEQKQLFASFWFKFPISIHNSLAELFKQVFSIFNLCFKKIVSEKQGKLLMTILERAGDSVEITNEEAVIQYVNPAFEKITLYKSSEAIGKTVASLLRRKDIDREFFDEIKKCLDAGKTWRGQIQSRKKNGKYWIAQTVIVPVLDEEEGKVTQHVAIKQDITEQVEQINQLKISEERYRNIMNAASDAIFIHDLNGVFVETNDAACKSLGYSREELINSHVWDVETAISKKTLNLIWQELQKGPITLEGEHRRKDGTRFPVEVRLGVFNVTGKKLVLAMVRNISEKKSYEAMLRHQATYDNLTNLPNRFYGYSKLEQAIINARKSRKKIALLFLDLDEFKNINDSLGHAAGDLLLKILSARYQSVIRQTDTIARLGGDEFMMIIENLSYENDAELIADKCLEACADPCMLDSSEILISVSIGIAIFPTHGRDAKTLMRNADTAMYKSKARGKNNWTTYHEGMADRATNHIRIKSELNKALLRDELSINYQPIIDIHNNEITGSEALLRWYSPYLGEVPPDQIIPIAEETGLIIPLGLWILKRACTHAKQWQDITQKPLPVAVNISALQLKQKDFVYQLKTILKKTKLPPELLILEITESAFIDDSEFILSQLSQLNAMNIHCSLDDFGMGYSSLSYIRHLPFKSLKIDKAFIQGIHTNTNDLNLVNSIIEMSKNLKLNVIAEGVETVEQLELIRSMNCYFVQGWLFSKPLSYEKFISYIQKHEY